MRFEITYTSSYRYDAPVVGNLNRLRMKPMSNGTQRCEHFDVRVEPRALVHEYEDLFGNEVTELLVAREHRHLELEVDALVATTHPVAPPDTSWSRVRTDAYREAAGIYLYPPEQTSADLGELIQAVAESGPAATVARVVETIPDRFTYRSGATSVDSSIADLLAGGAGVCQDFAHLALALLREHDIGARYVSGYFFTVPQGAAPDESSTEVQTHAWVEALLPVAGEGDPVWFGIDPTNRITAGERHVKMAHGRMYADVPPIQGTFSGAAGSEVEAHVHMRAMPEGERSGASLDALAS